MEKNNNRWHIKNSMACLSKTGEENFNLKMNSEIKPIRKASQRIQVKCSSTEEDQTCCFKSSILIYVFLHLLFQSYYCSDQCFIERHVRKKEEEEKNDSLWRQQKIHSQSDVWEDKESGTKEITIKRNSFIIKTQTCQRFFFLNPKLKFSFVETGRKTRSNYVVNCIKGKHTKKPPCMEYNYYLYKHGIEK